MPGRDTLFKYVYRFGFNGQEKDINIQTDHYTAEYWEYDSRIVRRWNVDPVPKSMVSPYMVLGDNPINNVDPLGNDWYHKNGDKNKDNLTWFDGNGRQKGYKLDKRGTGFWTDRNKNGISTYYGRSADDVQLDGGYLQDVVVRSSHPGKAASVNWFNIPDYNKADVDRWIGYSATVRDLMAAGKPLNYAGAPQEYLDMLPDLQRQWQANQDYRKMSYGAVGIIAVPVVLPELIESGAISYFAPRFGSASIYQRLIAAGSDATVQLMTKDIKDFNITSTLGSAFFGGNLVSSSFWGAASGTTLNLSVNSFRNNSFLNNPLSMQNSKSIFANTLGNLAGQYLGGAFRADMPWGKYYGDYLGSVLGQTGGTGLDISTQHK